MSNEADAGDVSATNVPIVKESSIRGSAALTSATPSDQYQPPTMNLDPAPAATDES